MNVFNSNTAISCLPRSKSSISFTAGDLVTITVQMRAATPNAAAYVSAPTLFRNV